MKIGIDAGHGNVRGGAVGYVDENIQNDKIADKVEIELKKYCEVVRLDDESERGNSLTDRTNKAKKENVDMIISIHANAGGGEGIETYIHNKLATDKDREFAELVQNKLIENTSFKNRGVKTANFHMVREASTENRVEVLLELGFVDNINDASKMNTEEFVNQCTKAIVDSVVEFYGLKEATVVENPTVQETYTYKQFVGDVQKACGAKVDYIAGSETLSKTVTVSARKNSRHAVVRPIQKYLYALGYTEVGEDDCIAGSKFTKAVKRYQKDNGCVVDGEITARNKTWKKLLKLA